MMGRQGSGTRRKLKTAAIAGPVLAGLVITMTATPAAASSAITSPSPDAVITEKSNVRIAAQVDGLLETGKLQLRGPTDDGFTTVDRGHGSLSHRLRLDGATPAHNGVYNVRLRGDVLGVLPGARGKRSFTVRVPPRQPTGLEAKARSDRKVRLQWDRGPEPDLSSYDVRSSSGGALRDGMSVDEICGRSLCSTTVTLPAGAQGEVDVTVRAHRRAGPDKPKTVASGRSEAATVRLASSPSPSPSVGASGNSPGVDASGASSPSPQSDLEMEPLSSSSPSDESEDPDVESPTGLPPVGAAGEGDENSGFSGPLPSLPTDTPDASGQASGPGTSWTAVTGAAQRWKTAAVIVIVLLVAAHLGGLQWRGRSRRTGKLRPGRGRTPATVTSAVTYASATDQPRPEPSRGRGTQSLRRLRSLFGAYRGRRRRFD